jgi:hypothetical protein
MELLCPNCQQRVTVPDQFAGQVMKCPHCNTTFTTPSLAPATASAFVPPPAPAAPVAAEPVAAPSSAPAPVEAPPTVHTPSPEPVAGDYRHRHGISLSPRVLPWIAVAALVIVFILTFFSWVGYYPGGIGVATQNAWQAAFGSYSHDPDLAKMPPLSNGWGKDQIQPGANGLLIGFIVIFLLALLAALLAATIDIVPVALPPVLARFRPWFWAIVSGISLIAFLLFVFQLLSGFSLTSRLRDDRMSSIGWSIGALYSRIEPAENLANVNAIVKKKAEVETALHASAAGYTSWLWVSLWLTLLAAICAALAHFLSRRTNRPLPRLELLW